MKYTFLFAALIFWSLSTANSQGFRAGVNAGYLMHLQPETEGPGTGVQAGAWASWLVAEKSRLQFSIGYRRLGGFNRLRLETEVAQTVAETQRTVSAQKLTALQYVDAELGWAFQADPESPWSYYAGAYYAHLAGRQGFSRAITSFEGGSRKIAETSSPNWPIREELKGGDFGLRLGIAYELVEGLSAQLHFRKGFPDLVPGSRFTDNPKDHLTAFSLGLSARLF